MTPKRYDRGFTLIELMMVAVIVGILAAVAYPSYQAYVLRGNRASAQAFLMDAAQRQAQYFLDNRAYAADLDTLFGAASPTPTSVSPYYNVTIRTAAGPPPTHTITAAPTGTQNRNNEPTLTINQAGTKTPATAW